MRPTPSWIFGSVRKDFLFLYMSSFIGYIAIVFEGSLQTAAIVLAIAGFFEAVHIYSTSWRIYFNPVEFKRNWLYWGYPVIFFTTFCAWFYFNIPHLVLVNFFVTFYHNYRQFYGINKWYQKINQDNDRLFDYAIYAVIVPPSILLVARGGLFPFLPASLVASAHSIYSILIALIFSWEIYQFAFKNAKVYRLFVLTLGLIIYGINMVTDNAPIAIAQLAFSHSIAYMGIMALTTQRLNLMPSKSFLVSVSIITITSILLLYIFRDFLTLGVKQVFSLKEETALIFYMIFHNTWGYSHYFIDAYLWRGKHPDAKTVYSAQPA